MRHRTNKGLTLVELMVVMAIIGILSASSIAGYQSYVGKAQATEALSLSSALRADIETALGNGDDPSTIVNEHSAPAGKWVEQILIDENGNISVRFGAGQLSGMEMKLSRQDNSPTWTCSGLPKRYLPSGCQASGNPGGIEMAEDTP